MDRGSQLDEEDEDDENDKDDEEDEEEEEDEEAGGRRKAEGGRRKEATLIKSNNPHLAGGESHLSRMAFPQGSQTPCYSSPIIVFDCVHLSRFDGHVPPDHRNDEIGMLACEHLKFNIAR